MRKFTERCVAAEREQKAVDTEPVRQITDIDWVRSKLYQWGRFVRERGNGYPPMAATEKARIGRGGGENTVIPFPPDLEVIEQAVSALLPARKALIVEHYTKNGYPTQKAARLGIARSTYYSRKDEAEADIANYLGI